MFIDENGEKVVIGEVDVDDDTYMIDNFNDTIELDISKGGEIDE